MPRQFEVFENPIIAARHAMPFVVVLQSGLTTFGLELVVAPLVPDAGIPARPRHLPPAVALAG